MRAAALLASLALGACVSAPPVAELLAPRDGAFGALQVRHYEGARPEDLPQAIVAVLQDFGFHVSASDVSLGLIVATRGYAPTAGEYARDFGQYLLQGFRNVVTLQWHRTPDAKAGPRSGHSAVVLVTPAGSGSAVRLALHRYVNRPSGEAVLVWAEEVTAPESYRTFFARLGDSLARERDARR
jgi:hypothetical protein